MSSSDWGILIEETGNEGELPKADKHETWKESVDHKVFIQDSDFLYLGFETDTIMDLNNRQSQLPLQT
jgi:hypothetical protein